MPDRKPGQCHDQSAVGPVRKSRDRALDLGRVAHSDRAQFHPKGRCHTLHRGKQSDAGRVDRIAQHCHARHAGSDLFEQLQPFRAYAVFERREAGVLPPGLARLATMPAPTGSTTFTNTVGTVRVACCNALTFRLPEDKMESGASATSSCAYLRSRSLSPLLPKRKSNRML